MATITFEMKDKHGRDAKVGDVIRAIFPEVLFESPDGIDFYRPGTVVIAKIYLPPAKGLQIKILDIVSENYMGDHCYEREELDAKVMPLHVGDMKQFRRTVLDWEILDEDALSL